MTPLRLFTYLRAVLPVLAGLTLVALALLGLSRLQSCLRGVTPSASKATSVARTVDTLYRDTLTLVTHDTVTVRDVVTRTVFRDRTLVAQVDSSNGRLDTVLVCNPFEAPFDTTSSGTIVRGVIAFPPLRLAALEVIPKPDTSRTITEVITMTTEVERAPPWYAEVGRALFWGAVGYGVATFTRPAEVSSGEPLLRPSPPLARVSILTVNL